MEKLLFFSTVILACMVSCQKSDALSETPDVTAKNAINNIPYNSLSMDTNGGGTVSASSDKFYVGVPVTLTATPSSDYEFDHWTVNHQISSFDQTVTVIPEANKILAYIAIFRPKNPSSQGVSMLTFHNLVSDSEFRNECEVQYIGPDGRGYVERLDIGCEGRILRFPVQTGSEKVTVYIQLESKNDPLYYCVATYSPYDPSSSVAGGLDLSLRGRETSSLIYLGRDDRVYEDMTVTLRAEMYDFRSEDNYSE